MVRALAHVVGAILQAGAVLKEPALKEAFFLLAADDRTGELHSSIHRFVPRMDDPVDLKVRGGLLRPGDLRLLTLVHFAFHQIKAVRHDQASQFEGIIILFLRCIRFRRDDGACAGSLQLVCHDGRAAGFHIQRAVRHGELAAPNAKLEEIAFRVRACNGHGAVLDGDVLVRAACPDRVLTNVAIDIARKGEGCVLQRQRAFRKDSIGVGKGGCAGNGQHIRQFGIDAVGKIRIPVRREVRIVQRQGVSIRVIGHRAVVQHVFLVGLFDLRTCYPEVVGFAFLLVRVHIRQLQIGVVCLFDFKKAVKFFLHAGVDFRITRVIVGVIPEPAYVLSDAQPTQAEVHTDSRHIQEQVAAVVGQMTLFPDVLLRMDHQLAAMVHGSEIGDAVFCICDLHLAIDLNASPADARLETLQRDSSIGSNRRFIVCSA